MKSEADLLKLKQVLKYAEKVGRVESRAANADVFSSRINVSETRIFRENKINQIERLAEAEAQAARGIESYPDANLSRAILNLLDKTEIGKEIKIPFGMISSVQETMILLHSMNKEKRGLNILVIDGEMFVSIKPKAKAKKRIILGEDVLDAEIERRNALLKRNERMILRERQIEAQILEERATPLTFKGA